MYVWIKNIFVKMIVKKNVNLEIQQNVQIVRINV